MSVGRRSTPKVRDYAASDFDDCLAVFDPNVPRYFRRHERDEFVAYLDDLPGPFLVLEDEQGRIVGCGGYALVPDEGRADLCWGMVLRDLHRTGLGRLLTEARLARITDEPTVREVHLSTSQHTTGFYERLGFRIVSVERDGFSPGLDRCHMVASVGELPGVRRTRRR